MKTCNVCGHEFVPRGDSWGGETCGNCLAASIELSLMGGRLLFAERKPAKRAETGPELPVVEETPRRRA